MTTTASLSISFLSHDTLDSLLAADLLIVLDVSGIVFILVVGSLRCCSYMILLIFKSQKTFDCRLFAVLHFLLGIGSKILCIIRLINRLLSVLVLVLILILCLYVLLIDV